MISRLSQPEWSKAQTLMERVRIIGQPCDEAVNEAMVVDSDLAARRLQRWCSEAGFVEEQAFVERLQRDGISWELFLQLLGEDEVSLQKRDPQVPAWLAHLEAIYTAPVGDFSLSSHLDQPMAHMELLTLLHPLISDGYTRLLRQLDGLAKPHPDMPLDAHAISRTLLPDLCGRLLRIVTRTLLLELQIYRLQGDLDGDTPEARYRSFITSLSDPKTALNILRQYPVLARQAVVTIEQWVNVHLELIQRFITDRETIAHRFGLQGPLPQLIALAPGKGDTHAGGRSVTLVTFATGFKLIYKPRSLAVDIRFQDLLAGLNAHGNHLPFRLLNVLDRGTHGWVEFISPQACQDVKAVQRFYQRLGALLALMYALAATDYHHENLIAAGEQLVFIDLEMLLTPLVAGRERYRPGAEAIEGTVLDMGLLPQRVWVKQMDGGLDISGMGADDNQQIDAAQLAAPGTDRMHWRWQKFRIQRVSTALTSRVRIFRCGTCGPRFSTAFAPCTASCSSIARPCWRRTVPSRLSLASKSGPSCAQPRSTVICCMLGVIRICCKMRWPGIASLINSGSAPVKTRLSNESLPWKSKTCIEAMCRDFSPVPTPSIYTPIAAIASTIFSTNRGWT